MRQSHLILSNAAIMWATQILLLVPQLIMVPYLIGTIGEAGYGVYALIWSLMLSIEQLQMSLQQGVVKYSAAFLAQGRMDEVNKVVGSSFVYSILLAVVTFVGILVAAVFYNDSSGQIGFSLIVMGIMLLLIIPLTPYIAVIQSRQRYYVGAIVETLSKYITLGLTFAWFTFAIPSVEALIIIAAGMLFLSRLAQVPIAYYMVPGLQNRPNLCNLEHFGQIVSFGGAIVFIGICLMVNSTGIKWMMGILASTSFVAHLAIMMMPSALMSQIVMAVTVTVMPATSAYHATGNEKMLQGLLIQGMRYTTILVLAGVIVAALLMRNVLFVWVGPNYVFLAPYAMALFASGAFMLSTSTAHHMLKGLGWLRVTIFVSLIGLVIVPIGMILVVFQFWHDPYMAVTAGFIAGSVVYGCLQIAFVSKAVCANMHEVFVRVYAQPLTVAAVVGLAFFGIVATCVIDGLVERVGISVLALLLFFSGCYFLISTAAERQQIREISHLLLNRFRAIRETLLGRGL